MKRFIRLSRLFVVAASAAASLSLLAGCTRADGPDVYAYNCDRRAVPAAVTPVSLSDAVEQQAAANRAYRLCVERRGVRAGR